MFSSDLVIKLKSPLTSRWIVREKKKKKKKKKKKCIYVFKEEEEIYMFLKSTFGISAIRRR